MAEEKIGIREEKSMDIINKKNNFYFNCYCNDFYNK